MSPSSDAALAHLQQLKPTDGWKLEYKRGTTTGVRLVRLTRRGVPVTDAFFLDVALDQPPQQQQQQVVGLLAAPKSGRAQAQVLIDRYGKPVSGRVNLVTVRYPQSHDNSSNKSNNENRTTTALTDAQNRDLLFYGGSAVIGAIIFRFVFQAMYGLYILAFPLLYLYLVMNCPSPESFDAKKELKRILRGHHLPENHKDKPKGLLEETLARLQATVTTELATLPGYEVTLVPLAGAVVVASCRVPSLQRDYYWIGACQQWWYVYANPLREAS